MKTIYAVIRPSTYGDGSTAELVYPLIDLYHRYEYPRVCGYSLGHEAKFFDTLEDAKDYLFPAGQEAYRLRKQDAIIELTVEDENVIEIKSIHQYNGYHTYFRKNEKNENYFEQVQETDWYSRDVQQNEIRGNACETLTEQLKERFFKPHHKDTNHPDAVHAKQLTEDFDKQEGGDPFITYNTRLRVLSMIEGMTLGLAIVAALLDPKAAILPAIASAAVALPIYSIAKRSDNYKNRRDEYVKQNFFAVQQRRDEVESPGETLRLAV